MNAKRNHRVVRVGIAAALSFTVLPPMARAQEPGAGGPYDAPYGQSQAAPPSLGQPAAPQSLPALPAAKPLPAGVDAKAYCARLLGSARAALVKGDLATAEQLARQATELRLPEDGFGVKEDSPARLAWDLQMARYRNDAAVTPAVGVATNGPGAVQALHVGANDTTRNAQVGYNSPGASTPDAGVTLVQASLPLTSPAASGGGAAADLIQQGEQRLRAGDFGGALNLFQQANAQRGELNPSQLGRLDSHLKLLAGGGGASGSGTATPGSGARAPEVLDAPSNSRSIIDDAESAQQRLARQLSNDVGNKQVDAKRLRASDPRGALQMLKDLRADIEKSELADQYRGQLIRRVDLAIAETDRYIEQNRAEIELDEQNAAVLAEVDRRRAANLKLQNRKAQLVDEFNKLRDEQRYAEAELVAKRLYEMLGPGDELASQILLNAKFLRREILNRELRIEKEENTFNAFADVERAAAFDYAGDDREVIYGQHWEDFAKDRDSLSKANNRLTPREIEIQKRLQTPVQVNYRNRPLAEVLDSLAKITGINIHLDPRGLSQEGVTSDTPVNIELTDEVMLKSALNLILEPLHLGYVVKDEVLKITSEQLRNGEVVNKVYYVADLVTPIPNFVPGSNFGLGGLINDAYRSVGFGGGGLTAPGPVSLVNDRPKAGPAGAPVPNSVVGQNLGSGVGGGAGGIPFGGPAAGGGGGGVDADFDSLIDLIISTVASETWAENGGGEAEIRPFFSNLSLVISQTQDVHEEIADLLEQLRRLQDLQITIEVRFITLNDTFFEQIGLDFDFNINDRIGPGGLVLDAANGFETPAPGAVVGAEAPAAGPLAALTTDLDIPFRQGNAGAALAPAFAAPNAAAGATFGFAILSDIEAFFLINAAQGDTRSNILEAPKVTLFNGQTALVADQSQTPFVISVIPVVGEFAAAQQPVIVVLSEGTMMNINAVVSEDRRYVRLTVVPFFSQITDVDTFTFEGSTTTSTSSSVTDDDDDGLALSADSDDSVVAGTTVQLPTFAVITVATTVSVPDGGTVLLGGIKGLSEGRNEFGVPLLSKVPYINRLFRNVGIGRNTDSLMFMVTPRIIIQEEEEEKLGFAGN